MRRRYDNKIVFDAGGVSHPFIDMDGAEQYSYNLENDAVRNYLKNVAYSKTDIVANSSKSTTKTRIRPYSSIKAYRTPWGSSQSAWSEAGRPVVIAGTRAGDTITFTSLDHTMNVNGTAGATLVYNLIPRRFYSYTVIRSGNTVKTGYFNTEGQCRMIRIQIPNFRDLGGWKCDGGTIAYNKLFRGNGGVGADTGAYVQLRDAANKTEVINNLVSLGITHELDLRDPNSTSQPAIDPGFPPNTLTYRNISLAGYDVNSNLVLALQFISNVLSNGGKVWFHCQTGADRTGTLAAVIQALLGCNIDSIIKEWELTMFNGNGYDQTFLENITKTVKFRNFMYDLYGKTGSTLKDKTIAWLKSNNPAEVTDSDIDAIVSNLRKRLIHKTVAVIGDSYSAYSGSGPKVEIEGFAKDEVYAGEYPGYAMPVNSIWWAQVAQHFGWSVANYSWSGCTVTPVEGVTVTERVCSSDARINRLSYLLGGDAPDIILCAIGYNDANAIANNNRYGITPARLEAAYRTMLDKITAKYPNAKVYCLNNVQRSSSGDRFESYKAFNTKLVSIVNDYSNATLIDVANVFGYTSIGNTVSDYTHPNATGFTKIATRIIAYLESDYSDEQEEDTQPVDSYDFIPTHLQPAGLSGGDYSEGIRMKASSYNEYEFAEFSVNAGDVIRIGLYGVNNGDYDNGTNAAYFFTEISGGILSNIMTKSEGYKTNEIWYDGCYEFQRGIHYNTVSGKKIYYGEYTVKHTGRLTVAIKVNANTTDSLGGAYVKINGELKS